MKEKNIPIIECDKRKDFPKGLEFYCEYCKKIHKHGEGEGHRVAHCDNDNSPYLKTGYILKLKKHESNL